MNYTKYLQTGGELAMPTSQYNLTNKDVDSLIDKILSGDKEAAAIFVDSAVNDPENAWVREAINGALMAAEQGDQSAQKFLGIISPMLAENGINLQEPAQMKKAGGSIPSGKAKGGKYGCPCMLKKVGGKLIEINTCDGKPVTKAKNGMKFPKFEDPFGAITMLERAKSDAKVRFGEGYTPRLGVNSDGMYVQNSDISPLANARSTVAGNTVWTTVESDRDGAGGIKGITEQGDVKYFMPGTATVGPDGIVRPIPNPVDAAENRAKYYSDNPELAPKGATIPGLDINPETRTPSGQIKGLQIKIDPTVKRDQEYQDTTKAIPSINNGNYPLDWYKNRYTKDQIANLQRALIRAGYDVGKAKDDGIMGKDTIKAIIQFQRDNGLTDDGKAGKATLGKLWEKVYQGKSYTTDSITPSAINLEAQRRDIYTPETEVAPYAQINPLVAANKQGGKIISYAQYLRK